MDDRRLDLSRYRRVQVQSIVLRRSCTEIP